MQKNGSFSLFVDLHFFCSLLYLPLTQSTSRSSSLTGFISFQWEIDRGLWKLWSNLKKVVSQLLSFLDIASSTLILASSSLTSDLQTLNNSENFEMELFTMKPNVQNRRWKERMKCFTFTELSTPVGFSTLPKKPIKRPFWHYFFYIGRGGGPKYHWKIFKK